MGLRTSFSNWLYRRVEKRGYFNDTLASSIRFGQAFVNDENVLCSSQVYELMQDISNQIALATWKVELNGKEQPDSRIIRIMNQPNDYLTHTEFMKLATNALLLHGEIFPVFDGEQIHLATNVSHEIDQNLHERFTIQGTPIPNNLIRHIKNIGLSNVQGTGLLALGRQTLEGVMSAEKVLTDKYAKGGILAFLLKLDAHLAPNNAAQSKQVRKILDQLEQIDAKQSVKLIPLGKGYEIQTLHSTIDDAKTLAYLNVYKKDLGHYLGIDVDTYEKLMQTDVEKAMMYLHNKAVRPILQLLEEHLSVLFFGTHSPLRLKAKINILDFVPYSTKTTIAYNLVRTMITTPDNVAEMLGFKPQGTPEATRLYISKDLVAGEDISNGEGGDQNAKEQHHQNV